MAENLTEEKEQKVAVEASTEDNFAEELVKKNGKLFGIAGAGLIVVLGAVYFFLSSSNENDLKADTALYRAEHAFSKDSFDLALEGNGNEVTGFLDVASANSGTDAGNLANYYAGIAYMNKGEFESAITSLKEFSSSDLIHQARAYSLIGDANLELGNTAEAVSFYTKAVNENPNKVFTPAYLLKLGLAQELNGDKPGAIASYTKVIEKYPSARTQVRDAKKYKGKLEAGS